MGNNMQRYRRIVGYFRSSLFEVATEALDGIEKIQIVCNSEVDPHDIKISQTVREQLLKALCRIPVEMESLLYRGKVQHHYLEFILH